MAHWKQTATANLEDAPDEREGAQPFRLQNAGAADVELVLHSDGRVTLRSLDVAGAVRAATFHVSERATLKSIVGESAQLATLTVDGAASVATLAATEVDVREVIRLRAGELRLDPPDEPEGLRGLARRRDLDDPMLWGRRGGALGTCVAPGAHKVTLRWNERGAHVSGQLTVGDPGAPRHTVASMGQPLVAVHGEVSFKRGNDGDRQVKSTSPLVTGRDDVDGSFRLEFPNVFSASPVISLSLLERSGPGDGWATNDGGFARVEGPAKARVCTFDNRGYGSRRGFTFVMMGPAK